MNFHPHFAIRAFAAAASSALLSLSASAGVIGSLGNFDVINDSGSTAHGFEIELEGLRVTDISDVFGGPGRGFPTGRGFDPATSVQRYGAPSIVESNSTGTWITRITYFGILDPNTQQWDYGTPSGTFITPGDNCWSGGGVGYSAATPCDHFGVGTKISPTKTTYNWLLESSANPAVLTNGAVTLPAPAWGVVQPPPPAPGEPLPPALYGAQVEVQAPENKELFGEAIWVKVFTTELPEPVKLEDLVHGNPKLELVETETEWQLLQWDPKHPESAQIESGYALPVGPDAESILRRYEFYRFAGEYDPETHEAQFADGFGDSNPGPNDIGTYLGAQNGGLNLVPVPEPKTYEMMLAGLAAIGLLIARRRRTQAGV